MHQSVERALGIPLFVVGSLALIGGLGTTSYWPMALGLLSMAGAALRFTGDLKGPADPHQSDGSGA